MLVASSPMKSIGDGLKLWGDVSHTGTVRKAVLFTVPILRNAHTHTHTHTHTLAQSHEQMIAELLLYHKETSKLIA